MYDFKWSFSYQIKNHNHKNITQETTGCNKPNQIRICRKINKVDNQIQKFKNISWILFSLNLKISFDIQVQKERVQTKNNHHNANKINSLIKYGTIQVGNTISHLMHKLINQNKNNQAKRKTEKTGTENFLCLNKIYNVGTSEPINTAITVHQYFIVVNIVV